LDTDKSNFLSLMLWIPVFWALQIRTHELANLLLMPKLPQLFQFFIWCSLVFVSTILSFKLLIVESRKADCNY